MKTDVIINRDALYALRELPSESVNCCVTSPPYYGLRDYGLDAQIGREDTPEQYIDRLVEVFRELRRDILAEYRRHILRQRHESGLQAKGFNRYSVASCLCPAL